LGGSITVPITEHDTLGDWPTSSHIQWSRGLCDNRTCLRSQPCSKIGRLVSMPCSGYVLTTEHNHIPTVLGYSSNTPCVVLRTCLDYSPTMVWGLDGIILIF
jgi:hypothetical protein